MLIFMMRKPPLALVVGFSALLVGVLVLPVATFAVELSDAVPPPVFAALLVTVVEATTLRIWLVLPTAASTFPALAQRPSPLMNPE